MDTAAMEPIIIGGHDLSTMRPNYDEVTDSLILASKSHLEYFEVDTGKHLSEVYLDFRNSSEYIVACERYSRSLYVCTTFGRILKWDLDQKEWTNEQKLIVDEKYETVCTLKVASCVSFIYTVCHTQNNVTLMYMCVAPGPRESPTRRQRIDVLDLSSSKALDIGYVPNDRLSAKRDRCYIAYINERLLRLKEVPLCNDVDVVDLNQQQHIQTGADFTCVRAQSNIAMLATGDSIGRIFIYVGDLFNKKIIRTELHWHSMEVNDMCFSLDGLMLFSVAAEAGCVACWDLSLNTFGQKKIIARLGMPFRHIAYDSTGRLLVSNIENEVLVIAPNREDVHSCVRTMSQSQANAVLLERDRPFGLLWHPGSDSVVTTASLGLLQFFSPHNRELLYKKDFLECNILSYEADREVSQSVISRGAISLDGNWLALYQTRQDSFSLPEIKLKLWRKKEEHKWKWVQTIERPHKSVTINDLQFSSDSKMLVSTSDDETFQIWYRIGGDQEVKEPNRDIQSFARGYNGKTIGLNPTVACFSQDSSILALSIKETSILLWHIENEQRLNYQTQLSLDMDKQDISDIIGINFGYDNCSGFLCEVRSNAVRVWSILDMDCRWEYTPKSDEGKITQMAFDHSSYHHNPTNCFAVITDRCEVLLFNLLASTSLARVNVTTTKGVFVIGATFVEKYIVESSHSSDTLEENLLRRLCLLNNCQELVAITDRINLESQKSRYNSNSIRNLGVADLGRYLIENQIDKDDAKAVSRLRISTVEAKSEVNKLLDKLFTKVPSHLLPPMSELGSLILSRLVNKKTKTKEGNVQEEMDVA